MKGRRKEVILFGLLVLALAGAVWWAATSEPGEQVPPGQVRSSPPARPPEDAGVERGDLERERQALREVFAQLALERVRQGSRSPVRYDRERFALVLVGKEGGSDTLNLHNFFEEYLFSPPEERDRAFDRIMAALDAQPSPTSYEQARPHLLPVVRARAYFELQSTLGPGGTPLEPAPMAWRPLGNTLGVSVVHDRPDTMHYLTRDMLAEWKVSFEEAYAQALANLRLKSREPLEQLGSGICSGTWMDGYGSSRLLLDEVVSRCRVRGQPVVLVPQRDSLLISGTEELEGLSHMAALAEGLYNLPRSVDGRALRRTEHGWEPFMPSRESAAWAPMRRLAVLSQGSDYAAQKKRLDAVHEQKGEGLFTAKLLAYENDDGRMYTLTTWTEGVDIVLPRADMVAFIAFGEQERPPEEPSALVRWDLVQRDVGHLLEPVPGAWPERFLLKGFPSPAQLSRWRAEPSATQLP